MKIRTLFILGKQKSIDLMAKDFAIIKTHKKSSMVSSKMGSWKEWENFIFLVGIITSVSLNSTKKMGEVCINGQENNRIFMKESSWREKETEEAHFGGLMEAGMKANLEMVCRVVMEFYTTTEEWCGVWRILA